VTHRVVDDLEPVEVAEQNRQARTLPGRASHRNVETVDEKGAVRKAREPVVSRRVHKVGLGKLAFGDVGEHLQSAHVVAVGILYG
jgi:hypothetical protein